MNLHSGLFPAYAVFEGLYRYRYAWRRIVVQPTNRV